MDFTRFDFTNIAILSKVLEVVLISRLDARNVRITEPRRVKRILVLTTFDSLFVFKVRLEAHLSYLIIWFGA